MLQIHYLHAVQFGSKQDLTLVFLHFTFNHSLQMYSIFCCFGGWACFLLPFFLFFFQNAKPLQNNHKGSWKSEALYFCTELREHRFLSCAAGGTHLYVEEWLIPLSQPVLSQEPNKGKAFWCLSQELSPMLHHIFMLLHKTNRGEAPPQGSKKIIFSPFFALSPGIIH